MVTGYLSKFSNWSSYRRLNTSKNERSNIRNKPIRHYSYKQVDFTNQKELEKNKHIFHRGFTKRNNSYRYTGKLKARSKFRNPNELRSTLNYINMAELTMNKVARVPVYKPENFLGSTPNVIVNYSIPNQLYSKRNNSIKRVIPTYSYPQHFNAPISVSNSTTRRPRSLVKRYNTLSGAVSNISYRSLSPGQRKLFNLWREYLRLVIMQRINLRVSLNDDSTSSYNGKGTYSNPIVIDDSTSNSDLYSRSSSFLSRIIFNGAKVQ